MKSPRKSSIVDPEHLSTDELLEAHERVFGRLSPEARRRMLRAMPPPPDRSSDSTYVLAA